MGIDPLVEVLFELQALVPHKKTDTKALSESIIFLNKLGVSAFVSLGPGPDDKDPDTVVTQVSPPWQIGLPAKDYYDDEKVVQKYTDTIEAVCDSLNDEALALLKITNAKESQNCKQVAVDVVAFEKRLASASPDPEDLSDVTVGSLITDKQRLIIVVLL